MRVVLAILLGRSLSAGSRASGASALAAPAFGAANAFLTASFCLDDIHHGRADDQRDRANEDPIDPLHIDPSFFSWVMPCA